MHLLATITFAAGTLITNVLDLAQTARKTECIGREFDITAPLVLNRGEDFESAVFGDSNAALPIRCQQWAGCMDRMKPGDVLRISGRIVRLDADNSVAECATIETVGHGPPPAPMKVGADDILYGRVVHRLIEFSGEVRDTFLDEVDPNFIALTMQSDDRVVLVTVRTGPEARAAYHRLRGARLSVTGIATPSLRASLRYMGHHVAVGSPAMLKVLHKAPSDHFDVQSMEAIADLGPAEMASSGRCRVFGAVVATLTKNAFLIHTTSGATVRIEAEDASTPKCGKMIEAVGLPASDLFHISLSRAEWRYIAASAPTQRDTIRISASDVISRTKDDPAVNFRHHGMRVRLSGHTLLPLSSDGKIGTLQVDSDGIIVKILIGDIPAKLPTIKPGTTIEATGVCVLDMDPWRMNGAFPHIRGFLVAVASLDDIRITAKAPWWAPARFLATVLSLLLLALVSAAFNIILRRLVVRRSRQLVKEQAAKLSESLRVDERTKLAAELHDSVAQDITGVALQIETAEQLASGTPGKLHDILTLASRTLRRCRNELRACLWDLRSLALDEKDFAMAIRTTLKPLLQSRNLILRFNVPRNRVSDSTAHAILRIIRELASNAIRHGGAKTLRIAGCLEASPSHTLRFSVADDGCGFEPDVAPGPALGHFGLCGVRERLGKLNGRMEIKSSPGNGTKVRVTI